MKNKQHKNPDEEALGGPPETFPAPPPSSKGKIIGIDAHPDLFTAAVFEGTSLQNAQQLSLKIDLSIEQLLHWIEKDFGPHDLFLIEAGSNSFELYRRIIALGRKALVLESAHVGKHAKIYADNDKLAAARIAKVYLVGQAPCVWVPDPLTAQRRQLLHAYHRAVKADTQATNSLKGYLNQFALRLGKRSAKAPKTHQWILNQRTWDPLEQQILQTHIADITHAAAQRKTLTRTIAREISREPRMLQLMSLLGIGIINAFALLAIIGDIHRFDTPRRLVAYLGLNPGQRDSGNEKRIKIGVGRRGRRDMRNLLIQGAHAILRTGRHSALGKWGWQIFARRGVRNIAVAAVARKLATQVWHLLMGNRAELLESTPSRRTKLQKLTVMLGKALRSEMKLPATVAECINHFDQLITSTQTPQKN